MVVTTAAEAAWARVGRFTSMVFSRSKTAPLRTTERSAVTVLARTRSEEEEAKAEAEAEDCRATAVTKVTLAAAAAVRAAMAGTTALAVAVRVAEAERFSPAEMPTSRALAVLGVFAAAGMPGMTVTSQPVRAQVAVVAVVAAITCFTGGMAPKVATAVVVAAEGAMVEMAVSAVVVAGPARCYIYLLEPAASVAAEEPPPAARYLARARAKGEPLVAVPTINTGAAVRRCGVGRGYIQLLLPHPSAQQCVLQQLCDTRCGRWRIGR